MSKLYSHICIKQGPTYENLALTIITISLALLFLFNQHSFPLLIKVVPNPQKTNFGIGFYRPDIPPCLNK